MTTIKKPASGWKISRITTHPGEVLHAEFLVPMSLSANQLAMKTRMPATRIGEIIKGRRGVSADTALRLSRFFGTSAEFWINLQSAYDLSKARMEIGEEVERDVVPLAS
ncbi:MAG TPA: HigA family addiction module antitoxin [Granulicella sp.]